MNILFLISNDGGNGIGGHYTSLNQISREIAKEHNVKILTLGNTTSPIISSNPFFESHIKLGLGFINLFKLNSKLKNITKTFRPDVVHCFDTNSLNRILLLPALYNCPVVLNKCGGRNPLKSNYQHADVVVVFSKENHDWFLNNKRFNKNDIFLIPNRVRKLEYIDENHRKEKKNPNKITFVRITRLGGAYEKTLIDTYNLIDELRKKYQVELIVIGRIQNQFRFEALEQQAKDRKLPVRFITDERAQKGSDFLYLADFVIGTGRSFMEATSLGLLSLTPVENADYPILDNFNSFFYNNFSERNVADEKAINQNLTAIEQLIIDKDKRAKAKKEILDLFTEYFGTEGILVKYNAMYTFCVKKQTRRSKLIKQNLMYIVKFLLGK